MSKVFSYKDDSYFQALSGDAESSGELLSQGIRAGPGAGVYDADEGGSEGKMADETGSSEADPRITFNATLAAIHTYRALYGNEVRSDFEPFVDALCQFWMDRFREGYPSPFWVIPAKDEEASDASKDSAPAPGPHETLEKDGR
jgi:hypothetical protein